VRERPHRVAKSPVVSRGRPQQPPHEVARLHFGAVPTMARQTLGPLRGLARSMRLRSLARWMDPYLPHRRRVVEYAGFALVHGRGDSLVERIEKVGEYEPETIRAVVRTLTDSESRILVDVGANIGLVSLAALARVPGATVYAFEPGPRQHRLLAKTIRRNGLEGRLELSPLALSDTAGTARFAVHSSRHAAGDGFVDTGRGGKSRSMRVRTETLDRWWEARSRPDVAVVKIDTEGSELLVLRGASRLVAVCRPVLLLEIHEANLRVYPFGVDDVRREVEAMGYRLEELQPTEFVARPV
jgi:FkbM family methyltransferase